jgi:cysteine synthase
MAEERGWFLTDQFNNPANVRAHEETTGAEILAQTGGRGRRVRRRRRHGRHHHAASGGASRRRCRASAWCSPIRWARAWPDWVETGRLGADGSYAVEGIGASEVPNNLHRDVIDAPERVSDEESFAMVRRLVREEGLLVGGSAGTNVVAALRIAARGGLDGPVVTVLPDSWDRYRSQSWLRA